MKHKGGGGSDWHAGMSENLLALQDARAIVAIG